MTATDIDGLIAAQDIGAARVCQIKKAALTKLRAHRHLAGIA